MEKKEKMIKRSVLGSMAALAVMAVVGCAEEITALAGGDDTKVEVTASFSDTGRESLTRAADGLDNSTAGFSLTTSESSSSKVRVMVDANNGTYSPFDYTITNATTITALATPPSFPSGVSTVNVYGWYPNVSLTNFSVNANQQSEANYCLSDLMVANSATCTRSGSSVTQAANLSFTHVMSKVKVSLTLASGVTVKAVKLKSILPQVTVTEQKTSNAVTSFNLSEASGSATDITLFSGSLTSASAAADKVLCGVFPPQSKNGAFLEITASYNSGAAQTITYSFGSAKAFARANEYTMNITLNGTNVTTGTVDISDWSTAAGTVEISVGNAGDAPTLSPTSLTLTFGDAASSITASAVGTAWTALSENTSVATVSGTGPISVTPAGVGSTTIHVWPTAGVSSGFSTASCPVTVNALELQQTASGTNGYVTIAAIGDQLYTGSAITPKPAVTVKVNGGTNTLVENTDFTYSYSNNTAAGSNTASVSIVPKSGANYVNAVGDAISATFSIVTCTGTALASATKGQIVCSYGKAHAATTGALSCGGDKVAVVAMSGYAIALVNASNDTWNSITNSGANKNVDCTLADGKRGSVPVAPTGTTWKVLNKANYTSLWQAMGSADTYNSTSNGLITAAGGTALSGTYWSTQEYRDGYYDGGWYFTSSGWSHYYTNEGNPGASGKGVSYYVRPVLVW